MPVLRLRGSGCCFRRTKWYFEIGASKACALRAAGSRMKILSAFVGRVVGGGGPAQVVGYVGIAGHTVEFTGGLVVGVAAGQLTTTGCARPSRVRESVFVRPSIILQCNGFFQEIDAPMRVASTACVDRCMAVQHNDRHAHIASRLPFLEPRDGLRCPGSQRSIITRSGAALRRSSRALLCVFSVTTTCPSSLKFRRVIRGYPFRHRRQMWPCACFLM